ncbi:hypothetical protein Tco_1084072 [Tanacetum coccineum]
MIKLTTFGVMCKEPSIDLLRSFLNLGRAGDWLTLSNRSGADFNFLPEGGFDDNQRSLSMKYVNNKTPIIDAEPISTVLPSNVAENIIDSGNTSSEGELPSVHPSTSSFPEKSKAAGKRKLTADALREEFPSARELKDATNCHWVVAHNKCNEALQDLDKNLLVSDMRSEIEALQGQEIDGLRQDKAAIVTKVVLDASMKLVHSDKMGVLVARLVKAAIIHGRCTTFEEVAKLKEPFILEKMPGYCTSSKEEYD